MIYKCPKRLQNFHYTLHFDNRESKEDGLVIHSIQMVLLTIRFL